MKTHNVALFIAFVVGTLLWSPVLFSVPPEHASGEPTISPTIAKVWPIGMKRGTTASFTIHGRSLAGATTLLFDGAGLTGKILNVTEQPEEIKKPRAGVDTGAAVPLGHKSEARIEITAREDVEPGLHWFRVQTPLGTSNLAVLDIGSVPEVNAQKSPDSSADEQIVKLPATLVGTLSSPGASDAVGFEGRAGEELVFRVEAARLGSKLKSSLVLRDASGKALAKSKEFSREPDAVLTYKLPADGKYSIEVSDSERGGGMDHFYRLNAGPLPYITSVFPLGVRAGAPTEVVVTGVNLGKASRMTINPPQWANGWTTLPLRVNTPAGASLNSLELAVGNEPEILEKEPDNTPAEAQPITIPTTINGHIAGGDGAVDEDYFRFSARKGEKLTIEVAAARLGSPLDSVVEMLDSAGHPVPRATIRCLSRTSTTLADRDSMTEGFRLLSETGLQERDYLMIGDELVQLARIPDQPDADVELKGFDGQRFTFLGTTPSVHPIETPVYKAEILPPDALFPPNGLPVFHLTFSNDDGGPGYGADSRLDFDAPSDGEYLVHIKDIRGLQGPDLAYRLTVRNSDPDFILRASPGNPNIPEGGDVPVTVSANRTKGYEGPIEISAESLPKGVSLRPATIPAGQDSTVVVISAAAGAAVGVTSPIKIVGQARVNGREVVRVANEGSPLQIASVIPPPDLLVTADQKEVTLTPGKEATIAVHIQRKNGFQGRVPCYVANLPPGVRVVNVGLNGVLVHEGQNTQTFTLKAEDWASPIEQHIYLVGIVESNSATHHASEPLALKVEAKEAARQAMGPTTTNNR